MEKVRAGAMLKFYKDDSVRDIMQQYFNSPLWKMKQGDPVPAAPLDIQFEPVNRCNLHCMSCDIDATRRDKSLMPWPVMTSLVDQAAELGVCYFTICGMGEASQHPRLFDFLGYLRAAEVKPKGPRALSFMPSILISNGMWSSAQVRQCIENPPDVLSLSLAGLTDEEIVERRGGINLPHFRKNVETIYRNRRVVRPDGGLSPTIHIATHIYPHELETRAEEIERFKDKWFQVADIIVVKLTLVKPTLNNHTMFTRNKTSLQHLQYPAIGDAFYEREAPCFETSRRLSLNSDGEVWCGHHLSENFGDKLGNVNHETLRDIWTGEKMNAFRREVRAGIFNRTGCKQCGGELRDYHRVPSRIPEPEIVFA